MGTFNLKQLYKVDTDIVAAETRMSICLQANGFSFSLIGNDSQKLYVVGEFECDLSGTIPTVMNTIKECFASIGVKMFRFANIRVVCTTQKNVWVPYKLFDIEKKKDYLKPVAEVHGNETVLSNVCEKVDAVSVFAYPMHKYSGVKILINKAEYCSQQQVLAEYAYDISGFSCNTLLVNKRQNALDLTLFKGNSFTLSNTITYDTTEDMIYNLLFVLQQTEVDTEAVKLLITGDNYTEAELQMLRRYVKDVSYANPMENIRVGVEFDEVNLQNYFLVLA
ncbi:MAG: DUF3822 family protein [Bacteroidales bacterium]|nr:DUF3822 family protein [Bacteroidales bacterium]